MPISTVPQTKRTAWRTPLRMAAFERYMLLDDRPDYAMTPLAELTFRGQFEREAFTQAVNEALDRHPLLRSRAEQRDGSWHWVPLPHAQPHIDWQRDDEPLTSPGSYAIDVKREIGLRIYVREGTEQTTLLVQFHHACADGHGMVQFLEDVLAIYAAAVDPRCELQLRPLVAERLLERDQRSARWRDVWFTVRDFARFLLFRPAPLAVPGGTGRTGELRANPLRLVTHVFDSATSRRLREAASAGHAQLNDYVLSQLLVALDAWNRRHGRPSERFLRVLMPTDLRDRSHYDLPAANVTGFAFLTRRPRGLRDAARLLAGIRDETGSVKRTQAGWAFLYTLSVLQAIPGVLEAVLRCGCASTAILSSLGDPTRRVLRHLERDNGQLVVGNVVLEHICFAPPVRPLTRASLGMTTYAGRVHLGLTCDPWLYTHDEACELMALLVEKLEPQATAR